jgi:hypothetical protein
VRAVAIGLAAMVAGPVLAAVTQSVPWPELRSYGPLLALDALIAIVLFVTQLARR